jgi:hypothetical protein
MTTRRTFIIASATCAAAVAATASLARSPLQPLRAEPRPRQLFLQHRKVGRLDEAYDIFTDAPSKPRPIIRRAVIDEVFGPDVYDTLEQPDHWRMIDAGWFAGSDLDDLEDPERAFDPLVLQWHAWHKPTSEAYWLLLDLFPEAQFPFGSAYLDAYDLLFGIHPCTPMKAEVSLRNSWRIEEFAAELALRSPELRLDTQPRLQPLEDA